MKSAVVETPNGMHWPYRCESITGNQKLASRPEASEQQDSKRGSVRVLIETRGEGGYVIAAPSNGAVHPPGKPYRLLRGGPDTITTLTPDERDDLLDLARSFNQLTRTEFAPQDASDRTRGDHTRSDRPGDVFNTRGTWSKILAPKGWTFLSEREEVGYWCRPGKDSGVSATTNFGGSDLLHIFTSSTDFDPDKSYNKHAAYAVLNHGGDFKAATKALADRGYGKPGAAQDEPGDTPTRTPVLICLEDVQPEEVDWTWEGRLARGKYQVLVGDPDLGKTTIALDCAARLSVGGTWPDGTPAPQAKTILLNPVSRRFVFVATLMDLVDST